MADPFDPNASRVFVPFVLSERYVDVVCDEPGYEGFSINARMNLKNRERADLERALADRSERYKIELEKRVHAAEAIGKLIEEAKAAGDDEKAARLTEKATESADWSSWIEAAGRETKALVAPYVRRWNVYTAGPDGEPVEVPAPMTGGVDAFDEIDGPMTDWIIKSVLLAYRGGKGFKPLLTSAAAKQGRGDGPNSGETKATGTPNSRASRKNSHSPEA